MSSIGGLFKAVEHIGLAAADSRHLSDWYVRRLGAQIVRQLADAPPAFMLRLPGGLLLEIYSAKAPEDRAADNGRQGWRHLALAVSSIEAAQEFLVGQGVVVEEAIKPAGGGGKVLFFKDGEENLWHIVERPDGFRW